MDPEQQAAAKKGDLGIGKGTIQRALESLYSQAPQALRGGGRRVSTDVGMQMSTSLPGINVETITMGTEMSSQPHKRSSDVSTGSGSGELSPTPSVESLVEADENDNSSQASPRHQNIDGETQAPPRKKREPKIQWSDSTDIIGVSVTVPYLYADVGTQTMDVVIEGVTDTPSDSTDSTDATAIPQPTDSPNSVQTQTETTSTTQQQNEESSPSTPTQTTSQNENGQSANTQPTTSSPAPPVLVKAEEDPLSDSNETPRTISLNILIAGPAGVGKSTLARLLVGDFAKHSSLLTGAVVSASCVTEGALTINLTVMVPLSNDPSSLKPTVKYVESQMNKRLQHQYEQFFGDGEAITTTSDTCVHCCLYLLDPDACVTDADIGFMRELQSKVNIIPIIGRADTIQPAQMEALRKSVRQKLAQNNLECYRYPSKPGIRLPLALSTGTSHLTLNDRVVTSNFIRRILFNQQDELIRRTHRVHYETYRGEARVHLADMMEQALKAHLKDHFERLVMDAEICLRAASEAEHYRTQYEKVEKENQQLRAQEVEANGANSAVPEDLLVRGLAAGEGGAEGGAQSAPVSPQPKLRAFAQYKTTYKKANSPNTTPAGGQNSGAATSSSSASPNQQGEQVKVDAALTKELLKAKYATIGSIGSTGERYNPLASGRRRHAHDIF
eukprot:comp23606_c0_seq1/m.40131 comp23606_c0_seq1/g.40131  ORF comp23606_c0_seq1/g.40131 comp23606_c0_seq1/m.40131 type:complete len:672 (-) comp23606_c0_seq1:386-2401(-)